MCGGGGSPAPRAPLNSGASFPRLTMLPLGAFLPAEPLNPIPSVVSAQPRAVLDPPKALDPPS